MSGTIGPHTDLELVLLLSGHKDIAYFTDDWVPDEEFYPYVKSGRIVKLVKKFENMGHLAVYYFLPGREDLAEELHSVIEKSFIASEECSAEIEARIGKILGYTDEDIEFYLNSRAQKRGERGRVR
jgi:hypothetical protein